LQRAALNPAKLAESLNKSGLPGTKRRRRVSNERNRPKRLLRSSLGRPYRGSPKKPNEVAAFHCVPGICKTADSTADRAKPLRASTLIAGSSTFLCASHYPRGREGRQWVIFDGFSVVLNGLPALLAGTWLGLQLFGRLNETAFRRVVLVLLLASGAVLMI
jgi:hypothetical protein